MITETLNAIQYNPTVGQIARAVGNIDPNSLVNSVALNGPTGLAIRTIGGFVVGLISGNTAFNHAVKGSVPFSVNVKSMGPAAKLTGENLLIEHLPHTFIPVAILETASKLLGSSKSLLEIGAEVASINSPMLPFESSEMLAATAMVATGNALIFAARHNYGGFGGRFVGGLVEAGLAATWGPIPAIAYHFGHDAAVMMRGW